MSKLSLGFSPCPNDTFMMYGLLHHKVDLGGLEFEPHIMDVEELNSSAMENHFDVTKLSFKTYYEVSDHYDLLSAGSALGRGNGPLLISKQDVDLSKLGSMKIAVPGMQTTATFLLRFGFREAVQLVPMLFSDIESAISSGQVDAGVIIHETRFLYAERGFTLIADLGEIWEQRTGMPIPLGGFAVKKEIEERTKTQVRQLITRSIEFAHDHYNDVLPYMKCHAQELDDEVIKQHVEMFVNAYSVRLGPLGEAAIQRLFDELNRLNDFQRNPSFI